MSADSPIIKKELREYVDILGYSECELLKKNREETKKLGPISIMQVGAAQGAFLSILCKCGKFKNCLEVGVFTGYSSLCISSAIEDDSRLTVIDNNNEYLDIAEKYWKLANVVEKINVIKKDALEALSELKSNTNKQFDFAFIDADKANYVKYYDLILPLIIFPSGYNMRRKKFFANISTIMKFGFIGTLICFTYYTLMTLGVSNLGLLLCYACYINCY